MSQLEWFFALLGVGLALIPWACSELGVPVPRFVVIASLVVGLSCIAGALLYPAYEYCFTPPTFVYLLPGRGLGENSADTPHEFIERRVFYLWQVGPEVLHNVAVTLHDNHALGQMPADYSVTYPEIDPGESNRKGLQPKHFWFKPSTPWKEDYSISISTGDDLWNERILVRGVAPAPSHPFTNPPPAPTVTPRRGDSQLSPDMGRVAFAVRVIAVDESKPLFTCQDSDLEGRPDWVLDSPQPCSFHNSDIPSFEAGLQPKPLVLNFPSGVMDLDLNNSGAYVLHSHPEAQSDYRRLSEWQQGLIEPYLDRYRGHWVLILVGGGPGTWRYAHDFYDLFKASHWKIKGPMRAPKVNQPVMDVQISIKGDYFNREPKELLDLTGAFKNAGVKGTDHFIADPSITSDVIVLWVGVKSPDEIGAFSQPPITSPEVATLVRGLR